MFGGINPGPMELVFNFRRVEYDLLGVYFRNYFGEQFNVDQINIEFFNLQDEVVANYTGIPQSWSEFEWSKCKSNYSQAVGLTTSYFIVQSISYFVFCKWQGGLSEIYILGSGFGCITSDSTPNGTINQQRPA
jgi:hypothetical protein